MMCSSPDGTVGQREQPGDVVRVSHNGAGVSYTFGQKAFSPGVLMIDQAMQKWTLIPISLTFFLTFESSQRHLRAA